MTDAQVSGPVLPPVRTRCSLPREFKADAVALVLDEARSIASVAGALGTGESSLGHWVRQARVDRGEREGLTTTERAELARLQREKRSAMHGCVICARGHRPSVGGCRPNGPRGSRCRRALGPRR